MTLGYTITSTGHLIVPMTPGYTIPITSTAHLIAPMTLGYTITSARHMDVLFLQAIT